MEQKRNRKAQSLVAWRVVPQFPLRLRANGARGAERHGQGEAESVAPLARPAERPHTEVRAGLFDGAGCGIEKSMAGCDLVSAG